MVSLTLQYANDLTLDLLIIFTIDIDNDRHNDDQFERNDDVEV